MGQVRLLQSHGRSTRTHAMCLYDPRGARGFWGAQALNNAARTCRGNLVGLAAPDAAGCKRLVTAGAAWAGLPCAKRVTTQMACQQCAGYSKVGLVRQEAGMVQLNRGNLEAACGTSRLCLGTDADGGSATISVKQRNACRAAGVPSCLARAGTFGPVHRVHA